MSRTRRPITLVYPPLIRTRIAGVSQPGQIFRREKSRNETDDCIKFSNLKANSFRCSSFVVVRMRLVSFIGLSQRPRPTTTSKASLRPLRPGAFSTQRCSQGQRRAPLQEQRNGARRKLDRLVPLRVAHLDRQRLPGGRVPGQALPRRARQRSVDVRRWQLAVGDLCHRHKDSHERNKRNGGSKRGPSPTPVRDGRQGPGASATLMATNVMTTPYARLCPCHEHH